MVSYEEKIKSKSVGYGLIVLAIFFFLLPLIWLGMITATSNFNLNELIEKITEESQIALVIGLFAILFWALSVVFFYQAWNEIKANGLWICSVKNRVLKFIAPSPKLEKSISIEIEKIRFIEKKVKDIGDGEESVIWSFILLNDCINLEHFGLLDIEQAVSFINQNHNTPIITRNFDIRGNEI
ncbi:hypothetical protein N474_18645 [Pseudoalteromonas luteoviolacea CPMOR-2]|uniref:Uncharacterized protein n=1 Tax=Pseudoalteromonas luteoviolacea DSM 6061 TaxID=1365250 RepID=A0A167DAA0_9GAMM|nr:hypothetical protein [Pseudoalteromonas luteoviolacea]KZN48605.1 hypothetical protein N475_06135 [Pseudoalteromonas luteoviolacea DSM 6061]KZN53972.1 hypothetical protein N474_18645 [Pseudoalteromonas luteoviolacea CPMOR-2]MBE0388689.1 hypothetical protein [Pseudoalteromonas luteoviolacea DSM 6061]